MHDERIALLRRNPASQVRKRSIVVSGHKTSVSLEDEFWSAVHDMARERAVTLSRFLDDIDKERRNRNLSSAIRVFVLEHYRSRGITAGPAQQ